MAVVATSNITKLGTGRQFLRIETHNANDEISLVQSLFIDNLFQRGHVHAAHGAATPLDDKVTLDRAEEEQDREVDPKLCQAIVRSLMCIILTTKPDILYTLATLSPYHWRVLA